jgi:hypothetical protein
MGFNTLTNSSQEIVSVVAGSAVAAGDLVTYSEAGGVAPSSVALGLTIENTTTAGMSVVYPLTAQTAAIDGGTPNMAKTACELGDGNVAFAFSGDGSIGTNNVNLMITTATLSAVSGRLAVAAITSVTAIRVLKISSTQFVVSWLQASSVLRFVVCNNNGTVAVAAVTVASLAGSSVSTWNVSPLAGGNFVFAYHKSTNDCAFSIFNPSGVLQGSETTVEAGGTPYYLAICGCANGDFAISYYRSAATNAYKAARYTASGVIIGSLVTLVNAGASLNYGDPSNGIIELANGSLVFATTGGSDASPDFHIRTSAMVAVVSIDPGALVFTDSECPQLIALDAGFSALGRSKSNNGTYLITYTNAGIVASKSASISLGVTGAGSSSGSSGTGVSASRVGAFGYAVARVGYESGGGNYDLNIGVMSPAGVLIGSAIAIRAAGVAANYGVCTFLHSSGVFIGSYVDSTSSSRFFNFAYNPVRRSLLGVAAETKTAGQVVRVQTKGTFAINQTFPMGGVFDQTAAVVPGTKGSISGTTAILRGTK